MLEQFRSPDKRLFQLALSTAREFPGGEVDKALATEMASRRSPQRAALMIQAMADRQETVVLPAVLEAARQGPLQVRLAAIDALGRIGDATCLPVLLEIAIDADAELAQTAAKRHSPVCPVKRSTRKSSRSSRPRQANSYLLLIELVGLRRIDAVSRAAEGGSTILTASPPRRR